MMFEEQSNKIITAYRIFMSSGVSDASETTPSVLRGKSAMSGLGNSPDREDKPRDDAEFTLDGDVGEGPDNASS